MRAPLGRIVGQSRRVLSLPSPSILDTYEGRVSNGATDDTEEVLNPAAPNMFPTSTDLELGHDDAAGALAVGVRFTNVTIRQGTIVQDAAIQFTSNNSSQSVDTIVRIWCEDIDNAPVFQDVLYNVSSRTKTTNYVDWTIPTWSTAGQADVDTTTPNLAPLVQEVVARPGWSSGNSLVFIIETSPNNTSTTPRRAAKSADLSSAEAPLLTINGGSTGEEPTPITSYSLLGDESFDRLTLDSTEEDTNAMTVRDYYDALYVGATSGYYDADFNSANIRPANREGLVYIMSNLMGLRVIDDLRLLDECIRLMELWYSNMTPDTNGYLHSDDPTYGDQSLDTRLQAGMFGWVGRACQINGNLTSPTGYNYSTIANKYHNYLVNEYLPRMRTNEGTEGPHNISFDGSALRHAYTSEVMAYIFIRQMGGGGGFTLSQWDDLITYSWNKWFEVIGTCNDGYNGRTTTVFQHSVETKEDPPQGIDSAFRMHYSTYLRYTLIMMAHLWMEGGPYVDERLNETFLTQVSNSFADFTLDAEAFSTEMLAPSIGGDVPLGSYRCGIEGGGDRTLGDSSRWMLGGWPILEWLDSRNRIEAYGFDRYAAANTTEKTEWSGYYAARLVTRLLTPDGGSGGEPVTPSVGWGSYTVDPNFSISALPAGVQTYASEAQTAWTNVWTLSIDGRGSDLEAYSRSVDAYQAGRNVNGQILGMAEMLWLTGDPHYLTNLSTLVSNMMTYGMTMDDPWGGKMYDVDLVNGGVNSTSINWSSMQLEDGITFGGFSTAVRILKDNGYDVTTALLRCKEAWRRWGDGAWSWDGVPGTYDASMALNHATANTSQKPFPHPMTGLALLGHNLYMMTGDDNYATGRDLFTSYMGGALIGYETGSSPRRASAKQTPTNIAHGASYVRYTSGHLRGVDRENGLGVLSFADFQEGMAYFLFRDADTDGGVRDNMAGGCSTCANTSVPVTWYTTGTDSISAGTSPDARDTRTEWLASEMWAGTPKSAVQKQFLLDKRAGTGWGNWTRSMGGVAGLTLDAYENL